MSEFAEWLRETYVQDPASDSCLYNAEDMESAWLAGRDAEQERLSRGGSFK